MTRTDICNSSDLVIVHIRETDDLVVYIIILFSIFVIAQCSIMRTAFQRIQSLEEAQIQPLLYNTYNTIYHDSDTSEGDPTDPRRHE